MADNIRWLLCFFGIALVVSGGLAYRQATAREPEEQGKARHKAVSLALVGLSLAWVSAQLPPFTAWGRPPWGRIGGWLGSAPAPGTLVACVLYLLVVIISGRGLIAIPQYRMLQARAEELRGLVRTMPESSSDPGTRARFRDRIDRAERAGRVKFGLVLAAPLPGLLRATATMNTIEKQMLVQLDDVELRSAARQIAASMPATKQAKAQAAAVLATLQQSNRDVIRDECLATLVWLHRWHDAPQAAEAVRVRVSMWLTVVGLAATYAISLTYPALNEALIVGALGGMLGSLSALILRQELSLGLIVLSPVAGALNSIGGLLVVSFLAEEEIQLLGGVFRDAWSQPTTLTALAVALLLGFSGGLFSRIALAGTAPLLATTNGTSNGDLQEITSAPDPAVGLTPHPRQPMAPREVADDPGNGIVVAQPVEAARNGHRRAVDVNVHLLTRRRP